MSEMVRRYSSLVPCRSRSLGRLVQLKRTIPLYNIQLYPRFFFSFVPIILTFKETSNFPIAFATSDCRFMRLKLIRLEFIRIAGSRGQTSERRIAAVG